MAKLILFRHLKSQWNLENRFTGWVDVPLAKTDAKRANHISREIFRSRIDKIYSSPLFRNQISVLKIFGSSGKKYPIFIHLDEGKMKSWGNFEKINTYYVPVYVSEKLNERYYGKLQGLNKAETIKKYGAEKVHLWRRGFKNTPPGGESLSDTFKRVLPFLKKYIEKDLRAGKNILVVASHNSLRALIKHIEKIPDAKIADIEVSYGGLIEYTLDKSLKIVKKETF